MVEWIRVDSWHHTVHTVVFQLTFFKGNHFFFFELTMQLIDSSYEAQARIWILVQVRMWVQDLTIFKN